MASMKETLWRKRGGGTNSSPLRYCDYIAHVLSGALRRDVDTNINTYVKSLTAVKYDLHKELGYMLSTKKTIGVTDINGNKYRITIEEDNND